MKKTAADLFADFWKIANPRLIPTFFEQIEIAEKILAEYPDSPYAHAAKAIKIGDKPEAIPLLSKAIDAMPEVWQFKAMRAKTLYLTEQYDKAYEDYTDVLQQAAGDETSRMARARILFKQESYKAALDDLQVLIERNYQPEDTLTLKGLILNSCGKHSEALALFTQVVESNPDNPGAKFNRATAFLNVGDMESAVQDLRNCTLDDPIDKLIEKITASPDDFLNKGLNHMEFGRMLEELK